MADQAHGMTEVAARRILIAALDETKAADLLACLFEGGAATVNPDGTLVLIDGAQLGGLFGDDE